VKHPQPNTRAGGAAGKAEAHHQATGAASAAAAPGSNAPPTTADTGAAGLAAAPTAAAPEYVTATLTAAAEMPEAIVEVVKRYPELREEVALVVRAKRESGRWRAGRQFTRADTVIPKREVTEPLLAALVGDPELIVQARVPAKPPVAS
jgi:hypothetical protein